MISYNNESSVFQSIPTPVNKFYNFILNLMIQNLFLFLKFQCVLDELKIFNIIMS